LANRPRAGLFTQTGGGVYSVVLLMLGPPGVWRATWRCPRDRASHARALCRCWRSH